MGQENETPSVDPAAEIKEAIGNVTEPITEVAQFAPGTPIAPVQGIAAIALSMALKYHDTNMVKDGVLYQQYKMEGKNMVPSHLDMVFKDAARIEQWLVSANERFAKMVVEAITWDLQDDKPEPETPPEVGETHRPTNG